ncbi:MAG: hypothetical protein V7K47_13545 [Nostoc sp.]
MTTRRNSKVIAIKIYFCFRAGMTPRQTFHHLKINYVTCRKYFRKFREMTNDK